MNRIEQLYSVYLNHPTICTDTRSIKAGSLFFALKGDKFNANEFAQQALDKGAAYAVIDEVKYKTSDKFILVDDVLKALQQLANHHRKQLSIPFIAITGSNGKTTSKELIAAVLSKKYKTAFTQGNLNNHIGVPLTLLSIDASYEMAVIEMGANHQGEIAMLCEIAAPDFGMITNIGKAHLEGFGGPEGVIKGKSEMYKHIKAHNGMLFVNADNELLLKLATGIKNELYGTAETNRVFGKLINTHPFLEFKWKTRDDNISLESRALVKTNLVGKYNFENLLAAACIGSYFNVDADLIDQALESYTPSNSRSQIIRKGSNTIIMDAYNANPTSMHAALENIAEMNVPNTVLILGDMLELGDDSLTEHQKIIDYIQTNTVLKKCKLMLVGEHFKNVRLLVQAKQFNSSEEVAQFISKEAFQNATILLKGSRGTKLEKVLEVV